MYCLQYKLVPAVGIHTILLSGGADMSGIFGFSIKNHIAGEKCLHVLDVWNRAYGQDGYNTYFAEDIGAGCHLEHFSEIYPASMAVIQQDNVIAVIDAVLYNREEILSWMNASSSISDEELLFKLIQEKGFMTLAQVNGDFAGAVYDKNEMTWTLFRDHSGVRPLFYYSDRNIFAFSTDMRGLAALPNADLCINEEKLYLRMMGYNDLSLCETEYANIRCIQPASWTVIRQTDNGFSFDGNIYWKWGQTKIRMKSDEEYQFELRRLVTDAIKRRLDAVSGIVGCELSGGLDSSVIAILISQLGREGRFFSWSFSTEDIPMRSDRDERKIIFDICHQENISCHFAQPDNFRTIDEILQTIDPPYLNTRSISEGSQYLRSQNARVVFTGHGGDEGVSHRCNFYELWYHHEYYPFFRNIYRTTRGKKLRLLRTVKSVLHQIFIKNPYFRRAFHKVYTNASRFVNTEFAERMSKVVIPKSLPFAYDPIAYIMQGGHRVRLDNIAVQGAENGVRYMVPFIDFRVLDFALSIPRAQYHNGYNNRYIYRQAFNDIIPQSLRDMHYKDTPSQQDYTPDLDLYEHFIESKKQLMNHFNPEYWKEYLNIEEIQALTLPENYTRDDFIRISSLLNEITLCCMIQNVAEKAAEWGELHV